MLKKNKKPVELHNYIVQIMENYHGIKTKIFEISVSTPRITFKFLRSLLDLIEKYGKR